MIRRRSVLLCLATLPAQRARADDDAAAALAAIERERGGRLGVSALDTGTGRRIGWRDGETFPMQSTFKAPLAALALFRVQTGRDRLDEEIPYGRGDVLPVSPVSEAHVAEGRLPVATLVAAILERSDNTAANLLLAHAGGPAALTGFLRGIGDHVTVIRRGEEPYAPEQGDNTTSPRAFADTLLAIATSPVLQPALRDRLVAGMGGNLAGRGRLRAAAPAGWRGIDRTGTSDGICKDGALFWPPGRAPIVVAVFHHAPGLSIDAQEAALRETGRVVAERFR